MISFANSILMVGRDSANFQWEEWKYEESRPRVSTISVRSLQFQFSNNKKVWIKEHILNQTKSASAMPALNREMHQNFTPILWTPPPSTNLSFTWLYLLNSDILQYLSTSCPLTGGSPPLSRPEYDAGNLKNYGDSKKGVIKAPCLPKIASSTILVLIRSGEPYKMLYLTRFEAKKDSRRFRLKSLLI